MLFLSIFIGISSPSFTDSKPSPPAAELTPQQKADKVAQFFATFERRHERPAVELIKKLTGEINATEKSLVAISVKSKQYAQLQEKLLQAKKDLRASELILKWGELNRAYTKAAYANDDTHIDEMAQKLALVNQEYMQLTKKVIYDLEAEKAMDVAEAKLRKAPAAKR